MADDPSAETRDSFGAWLLRQRDRSGWVGDLAQSARTDPQFPRTGSPEDVRAPLRALMVDGDMFEAIDDAEGDWLSER